MFDNILYRIQHGLRYEKAFYFGKKRILFPASLKVVSFTFDDFPESAAKNGSRVLESYDLCGTFYASFGLAGTSWNSERYFTNEEMVEVYKRGHEIGCHTYDHTNCYQASKGSIAANCKKNQTFIKDFADISMTSFAYPYGDFDTTAKNAIENIYASARTTKPGINVAQTDLYALKSVPFYQIQGKNYIVNWLDKLDCSGGWLIFFTHDVQPNPSVFGCSEEFLKSVVEECVKRGFLIMPVKDVLQLIEVIPEK
jgi:peptidoglycan/xylan/chitin deacetylase (PgdA/CDA1 family)